MHPEKLNTIYDGIRCFEGSRSLPLYSRLVYTAASSCGQQTGSGARTRHSPPLFPVDQAMVWNADHRRAARTCT